MFFSIAYACTPSSNLKSYKVGPKGERIGRKTAKCTPPSKTYAPEVEFAVSSAFDSLKKLPIDEFKIELKKKVVRLSDYSSQGLDIDKQLFRLCEIAHNENFTREQTAELFKIAQESWREAMSKKSTFINNGTNNGIQAVNYFEEKQPLPLDSNINYLINYENGFFTIKFSPREGQWNNPFFAYPSSFNEKVILEFPTPLMNAQLTTYNILEKESIEVQIYNVAATINTPYKIKFLQIPPYLFVGDTYNDKTHFRLLTGAKTFIKPIRIYEKWSKDQL